MRRIVVNLEVAFIFNGCFETKNSSKKQKKFAKMQQNYMNRFRVYHADINHAAPPMPVHRLLGIKRRR